MKDISDVVKNISEIYDSDVAFTVLKDFERVLDDLDVYVYDNWEDGEIVFGPKISRHRVTCAFMWEHDNMPDPMGGKRLLDYDCKVTYKKDKIIKPRKIRKPDDIRPGTKKGKLDTLPIWVVEIMMPKKLIADIYGGYKAMTDYETDTGTESTITPETQPADTGAEATADVADAGADLETV